MLSEPVSCSDAGAVCSRVYLPAIRREERARAKCYGACLLCPELGSPQSPPVLPELPALYHCPLLKGQAIQLCQSPCVLPGGSCLDRVFHSLLIHFRFKRSVQFKVMNRVYCVCFHRYSPSTIKKHCAVSGQKRLQNSPLPPPETNY